MLWKKLSNGQLAANRENAKKSTGPTSATGKEKVAQNRTTHGLTGAFRVLPNEKQERFEELFNQFMLDENPVGSVEIELVRKMAEHTWCARRASCLLEACFLVIAQTPEQLTNNEAEMRVRPESTLRTLPSSPRSRLRPRFRRTNKTQKRKTKRGNWL